MQATETLIDIGDTKLNTRQLGEGFPLVILHGGPGLDHHVFGDYLDPLAERYQLVFVDQRGQGRSEKAPPETLTIDQMAADVSALAGALDLGEYAVLGHSYGAFVALQHAVSHPGEAAKSIISSGVPAASYLAVVEKNLEAFEPVELREQVTNSWAKETDVQTPEAVHQLLAEQMPFHFKDPFDPRMEEFDRRTVGARYSPEVLRHFAVQEYGGIDVEDKLSAVPQPVLVLAGRHDRACSLEASEAMHAGLPDSQLVVFDESAHMTLVEENEKYLEAVSEFLG
ncbi:MAG: alpha/beta fold hydrolase [Anaerolineae bacterium]|nr:alpha/beta fold hydrolase [Anaerolineae bacterium]